MISKKRRWFFVLIFLGVLFIAIHMFFMKTPVIEAQSNREKQFTSIQVRKGDSLWKIAKEYMGDEYNSVDDYIEEVCKTNHIYDGKITDGMYLVVPYYTTKQDSFTR